jgi:hypothetical protein
MSDAKHTPAPWQRIGWMPTGIYGTGNLADAIRICRMDRRKEHDADANIIIAAPDMLAAIKAAVALADANQPHEGRTSECQAVYDQCVAAINKAEGR